MLALHLGFTLSKDDRVTGRRFAEQHKLLVCYSNNKKRVRAMNNESLFRSSTDTYEDLEALLQSGETLTLQMTLKTRSESPEEITRVMQELNKAAEAEKTKEQLQEEYEAASADSYISHCQKTASKRSTRQDLPCIPLEEERKELLSKNVRCGIAIGAFLFAFITITAIFQFAYLSKLSLEEAEKAEAENRADEALKLTQEAVNFNPLNSRAYTMRGKLLAKDFCLLEAERCLSLSLSLCPNDKEALDNRAAISLKLNKPAQTIADIEKLKGLSENELEAYQAGNLAAAQYATGHFEEALHNYETATTNQPHNLSFYSGRIYSLLAMSKTKLALNLCEDLINQFPESGDVFALRGLCLQQLNKYEDALHDFDKAIGREPKNVTGYRLRAGLHLKKGNKEKACADLLAAAKLDSFNIETQINSAQQLLALAQVKQAGQILAQASRMPEFKSHKQGQALLVEYYLQTNDYKAAEKLLRKNSHENSKILLALCLAKRCQSEQDSTLEGEALDLIKAMDKTSASASELYLAGRVATLLKQELSAIDYFTRAIQSSTKDYQADKQRALVERAKLYFERQQLASCKKDLEEAEKLAGLDVDAARLLQHCRNKLDAGAKIVIDLPKNAHDLYKNHGDAILSNLAYQALQKGDFDEARLTMIELTQRQPRDIRALKYLVTAQTKLNLNEEAVDTYGRLAALEALDKNAKLQYAKALGHTQNFAEAMAILESLKKESKDEAVILEMARVLDAQGQGGQALSLCRLRLADEQTIDSKSRHELKQLLGRLLDEDKSRHVQEKPTSENKDTQG